MGTKEEWLGEIVEGRNHWGLGSLGRETLRQGQTQPDVLFSTRQFSDLNPQASTQTSRVQQNQQTQDGPHQNNDKLFSLTSRFISGMKDYRHRGQGGLGQLSGSERPQTGNIEFPAPGRNGNDDTSRDQRGSFDAKRSFRAKYSSNPV